MKSNLNPTRERAAVGLLDQGEQMALLDLCEASIESLRRTQEDRDLWRQVASKNMELAEANADEIDRLQKTIECYEASRLFWVFSVRQAIERGDVEAVRQNAINHDTWTKALQAEVEGLRFQSKATRMLAIDEAAHEAYMATYQIYMDAQRATQVADRVKALEPMPKNLFAVVEKCHICGSIDAVRTEAEPLCSKGHRR